MSRSLIYSMISSLDGFVATPDGGLDWIHIDEELHTFFNRQDAGADLFLYGRGMYETMAPYWPSAADDPASSDVEREYGRIWTPMKKIVFSTTLESVAWNSELRRAVDPEEIAALKAQPGKMMTLGGPTLAATFLRHRLVDEIHVTFQPVVLGAGLRMFPELDAPLRLELLETRTF